MPPPFTLQAPNRNLNPRDPHLNRPAHSNHSTALVPGAISASHPSSDLPAVLLASAAASSALEPEEDLRRRLSTDAIVRAHEPLAARTTLRVGGPADLYVEPATETDLSAVLGFCVQRGLAWMVLGRGSNLLVRDGGVRGVVISLAQPEFSRLEVIGERVRCGAGARLKAVALEARRHGLTGLEFLEGIPGSVGGALRMNAGAMGSSVFNQVESVRFMDPRGEVLDCPANAVGAQYRSCVFFRDHIALTALLRGQRAEEGLIRARMDAFSRKRWESQPPQPSAGCIFKNPGTIAAGRLIDELGLKGARVGGAVVSDVHANFIINQGGASARDILELIDLIRQRARQMRGLELETEVEIVGEP